eukprot:55633_1
MAKALTVLKVLTLLLPCNLSTDSKDSNCSIGSKWFKYPIHDLSDPFVQSMVSTASMTLRDTSAFIITPFLSSTGLSTLQEHMLSADYNKQEIYRSVFQDMGDLENFPDPNHSRNRVGFVRLGHTNRQDLPPSFEELYAHEPLLSLLKTIVAQSGVYNETNATLYRSTDTEGAVYSLWADPLDHGSWHYDQHPFSCVLMIHKPFKGGVFELVQLEPVATADYWKTLQLIWDRDTAIQHYISTIEVDEGGLYCFTGNITLHQVTKVEGDKLRGTIIMTFATQSEFKHSDDILNLNFVDGIVETVQLKQK